MARLYVGGLAGAVRPHEIQESFARAGARVEGVELMQDAEGRSKGFAYVQVADQEGAEKCIKLYNRTAWRGGRLRVELASEAYMDRLRREWAERDGGPPEQQPEAAVSSSAPPAAGEGEGEQQQPGKRREKRYLRLRRKAGEKALVVDTLPLLLRAEDKSSGSGKKRPRLRAVKVVDFSAGSGTAAPEKSLQDIWADAFGPPVSAALDGTRKKEKKEKKRARVEEGTEMEEAGAREADVAALLEAGEGGELDFAWGEEEEVEGEGEGEEEQEQEQEQEHEQQQEEAEAGEEEGNEEEEEGDEEEEEEEDEELAQQLREEEERNQRVLSSIMGGLAGGGESRAAEGGAGKRPVAAARERAPQALAVVPRFDPTSDGAGELELMEEGVVEVTTVEAEMSVQAVPAAVPLDPATGTAAAVATADVDALTDIYRTFRPEEGEEPVPIGAQDAVGFSFGFALGAASAAAATAPSTAGPVPAVDDEEEAADKREEEGAAGGGDSAAGAVAAAEEDDEPPPAPALSWRSPAIVKVMWPTLAELEERARAFVAGGRGGGGGGRRGGEAQQASPSQTGAEQGQGPSSVERQRPRQHHRGDRGVVDEGWRRERHNLAQDFKRKRRNAVKSSGNRLARPPK